MGFVVDKDIALFLKVGGCGLSIEDFRNLFLGYSERPGSYLIVNAQVWCLVMCVML
jgi:hypothetical protein